MKRSNEFPRSSDDLEPQISQITQIRFNLWNCIRSTGSSEENHGAMIGLSRRREISRQGRYSDYDEFRRFSENLWHLCNLWFPTLVALISIFVLPHSLAQEDEPGTYSKTISLALNEGKASLTIKGFRVDQNKLQLYVFVEHYRNMPEREGAADALDYMNTGVKIKVQFSGEKVLNPKAIGGGSGTTIRENMKSEADVGHEVRLKEDGLSLSDSVTLEIVIVEPHGKTHTVYELVTLADIKKADCRLKMNFDARVAAKLKEFDARIAQWNRKIRAASDLADELKIAMINSKELLNSAVYCFDASKKAEDAIEEAFKNAKTFEDMVAITELVIALGKAGLKYLVRHNDKILKALKAKPGEIINIDRAFGAFRNPQTPAFAKVAKEIDEIRIAAARKALERMRGGDVPVGFKWTESDGILSGSTKEMLEKGASSKWKILRSDIDAEFSSREMAEHFEKLVADEANLLLKGKGYGTIAHPSEMIVNTFVGNASDTFKTGFEAWKDLVTSADYLANPDAYRALGNQLLAKYFGKKGVALSALDGHEIFLENAARAELFWKSKNYLDPKVYKDIRKCYERALLGKAIKEGKFPKLDGSMTEQVDAFLLQDDLLKRAKGIPEGQFDRRMVDEMLKQLDSLKSKIGDIPAAADPKRLDAFKLSMELLEAEKTGKELATAVGEANRGLELARAAWADEARIDELIAFAMDPRRTAAYGGQGILNAASHFFEKGPGRLVANPWTSAVMGWGRLFLWDDPDKQSYEEGINMVAEAVRHLWKTENTYWKPFCKIMDELNPAELEKLRADLQKAMAEIPDSHKDCFELVVGSGIGDLIDRYRELKEIRNRIKQAQELFPREKLLERFAGILDLKGNDARVQRSAERLTNARKTVEGLLKDSKELERQIETQDGVVSRKRTERAAADSDEAAEKLDAELKTEVELLYALKEKEKAATKKYWDYVGNDLASTEHEFDEMTERKKEAEEIYGILEKTLPDSLHFDSLSQALSRRADENIAGNFPTVMLREYCAAVSQLLEGMLWGRDASTRNENAAVENPYWVPTHK